LGLIDMKARMYNPLTAMFLSVDPLGDAYTYAGNNPLKYIDPTGLVEVGHTYHIPDYTIDHSDMAVRSPSRTETWEWRDGQWEEVIGSGGGGATTSADAGGAGEEGGGTESGRKLLSETHPDARTWVDEYGNRWIEIDGVVMLDMIDESAVVGKIDDEKNYKNGETTEYNGKLYVLWHNKWLEVDSEGAARRAPKNVDPFTYPWTQKAIQYTITNYECRVWRKMAFWGATGGVGISCGKGTVENLLNGVSKIKIPTWGAVILGAFITPIEYGINMNNQMREHDEWVDFYRQTGQK